MPQIGTPPRAAGDPFAAMFTPEFLNPVNPGPQPSGSLAHDLFGASSAAAGQTPNRNMIPGGHGIGGMINGMWESLFGGGGGGANLGGGVGMLGDFDPFQYVESSLARMQHGGGSGESGSQGGGLAEAIGSITRLIGMGG